MPGSTTAKVGVLVWNQYTEWPAMLETAQRADALGYDSLWAWDHLYPIIGDPHGPFLEGYMVMAGWSQHVASATIGLLVGANTFRVPGLVVKMITTLDHLSDGRAVLGIGGAWFDREHVDFGIDFGSGFGQRLDWLDESVQLMRDMLRDGVGTARGQHYHAVGARNDPAPVQSTLPILIGGGGEKKTLRTVAKYADLWNISQVTAEQAAHKIEVLRRHCDEVGRDFDEIELTLSLGPMVIRDEPAAAEQADAVYRTANPRTERELLLGSAEQIAEFCSAYAALGFTHFIYHSPAPHDGETLKRFATEVRPAIR